MVLRVDPEKLRAFAGSLTSVAGDVQGIQTAPTPSAMPGTQLGGLTADAASTITRALNRVAERISSVADIAKGTAGNYEVNDDDFKSRLESEGGNL